MNKPTVLVIAGFDPSGGAGIIADAKTLETIGVQGVFVQSCNTVQTTTKFFECYWVEESIIWQQLDLLLKNLTPKVIKIGVVKNLEFLDKLLEVLKVKLPKAKIIWDPIVKSSSGFDFHHQKHFAQITRGCLSKIDLITPNYNEIAAFTLESDHTKALEYLKAFCRVYLKGGHRKEVGVDELYQPYKLKKVYYPRTTNCSEKHGSGCVLSSAIAAYYANCEKWEESCEMAKLYVERYLASTTTLMGSHLK